MVVSSPKLGSPHTSLPVSLAFFQLLEHSMLSFATELFNMPFPYTDQEISFALSLSFSSHFSSLPN